MWILKNKDCSLSTNKICVHAEPCEQGLCQPELCLHPHVHLSLTAAYEALNCDTDNKDKLTFIILPTTDRTSGVKRTSFASAESDNKTVNYGYVLQPFQTSNSDGDTKQSVSHAWMQLSYLKLLTREMRQNMLKHAPVDCEVLLSLI